MYIVRNQSNWATSSLSIVWFFIQIFLVGSERLYVMDRHTDRWRDDLLQQSHGKKVNKKTVVW